VTSKEEEEEEEEEKKTNERGDERRILRPRGKHTNDYLRYLRILVY